MSNSTDEHSDGLVENNHDYESLRLILEEKRGKSVSVEEAKRIGDDLIDLYRAFLSPDVEESGQDSNESNRGRKKRQKDSRTNKKGS